MWGALHIKMMGAQFQVRTIVISNKTPCEINITSDPTLLSAPLFEMLLVKGSKYSRHL
jgi:hypothetical protein